MKTDKPSPGAPLGIPEDRLQVRQTAFPWNLSQSTRGQTIREGQTSLPLVYPSRNARGQTTCRTDEAFPWCTLLVMPENRLTYSTDKAFPWCTLLGIPEDRLHVGQTSLPLVYPSRNARGQTTCRTDEAFLWCTLLRMPEDRLTYRTDNMFVVSFSDDFSPIDKTAIAIQCYINGKWM